MKKINSKHIFYIYGIMLAITVITVIISVANPNHIQHITRDYFDFSEGWVTEDGSPASLSEIAGTYTISQTLPSLREDDILYFNAKTLNVSIYLEDECIYCSDVFQPKLFGYTPGSFFVRIPFHVEDSGKVLTMVLDNPYHDHSGKITQIRIGNSYDMLVSNISGRFGSLCVSLIIVFIGLLFTILFFPMWKNHAIGKEMLFFGCFAFSIGMFMLTDCKLLQELFQNAHIYHVISEIFMMLIIIPMFLFFESIYQEYHMQFKLLFFVCFYSVFDFVVSYFLAITGIMDYHQTIRLTHISYVIAMLALIIITAGNMIKKKPISGYHFLGILFICAGGITDIVLWNIATLMDSTFFTRIGVLLFMICEATQLLSGFLLEYKKVIKSQFLEKLAYQDGLTDLFNRTSYTEEIKSLENKHSEPVLVAFFDINNLKVVNDTLGHALGDELLLTFASTFKQCFSGFGKCYRIGGDEFVFITTGNNVEKNFSLAISDMQYRLNTINSNQDLPFQVEVASGYSVWKDDTVMLADIIQEADSNMYANKKEMKVAKNGTH